MPSPVEDLRALLSLINTSAEEAISIYEAAGSVPTLDTTEAFKVPEGNISLKRTLRTLEAACNQLTSTLMPPDLSVYTVSHYFAATIMMLMMQGLSSVAQPLWTLPVLKLLPTRRYQTFCSIILKASISPRLLQRLNSRKESSCESCGFWRQSTVSAKVSSHSP